MYSLNKLESYSRISALGPVGHCTSRFKRAVCISCRLRVDVHKGEEGPAHVDACGQGEGVKNLIFCGCHKWMAPIIIRCAAILSFYTRSMDKKFVINKKHTLKRHLFKKL